MNIFDNLIYTQLKENVETFGYDDLDHMLFHSNVGGVPCLGEGIRVQILTDIDEIRHILPVVGFYITGNILTRNYERSTPIDVNVQVDAQEVDNISVADIMHLLKRINGRMASGTMHPINYYITTHELDDTKVEAVYDVMNLRWIKTPQKYNIDVEKILENLHATISSIDSHGNIMQNLVEVEEIERLQTKDIKRLRIIIKEKLYQVEVLLRNTVSINKNPGKFRKVPFELYTTPEEIHLYGMYHHLSENILQKLFEKYYYLKFIEKIEKILNERDSLELSDNKNVNSVMSKTWKT